MSQRNALLVAIALTAFVLAGVGAIVGRVSQSPGPASVLGAVGAVPAAAAASAPPVPTPSAPAGGDLAPVSYSVTPQAAAAIGLGSAPGARLLRDPELVDFQGTVAYEVSLDQGKVYVAADSGQVVYNGAQTAASGAAGGSRAASDTRERDERPSTGAPERYDDHD